MIRSKEGKTKRTMIGNVGGGEGSDQGSGEAPGECVMETSGGDTGKEVSNSVIS